MEQRIIAPDVAQGLLDGAGIGALETAIGRTYNPPTTEHFVRIPGASFAVAAEVCGADGLPSEAVARLFAAAPNLAASVIAQHAELDRLSDQATAKIGESEAELFSARAEVARLRAELSEARLSNAERQNCYVAGVVDDAVRLRQALRDLAEVIGVPYVGPDGLAGGVRLALDGLRAELAEARAVIEGRIVPPTDAEITAHAAVRGAWIVARGRFREVVEMPPDAMTVARIVRAAHMPSSWWPIDANGRICAWPVVASEPARSSQAYLRLWPAASQIVADEGLLRDDVTAALGRASMDGRTRVEMTSGRNPKRTVVFACVSRDSDDVFVWTATVEGGQ